MDWFKNFCWCFESNWGTQHDNLYVVTLKNDHKDYLNDWESVTVKKIGVEHREAIPTLRIEAFDVHREYTTLNDEVIEWLNANIADMGGEKGWCIGSEATLMRNPLSSMSIFFKRRKDSMRFIQVWSHWGKPLDHFDYLKDERKYLNTKNRRYKKANQPNTRDEAVK